jgi:phosphatidylserine/phosphatidylglycerophosphate/cardiolipin synthase-like enzyme
MAPAPTGNSSGQRTNSPGDLFAVLTGQAMRRKRTVSELELYAVSGTNSVVLSLDMKAKPSGLLGFAFERVETKSQKRIWLYGQKFFGSVIPIAKKDLGKVKGQKYPTHLHPVQGFLWKDFTVEPGTEYTYIVTAYKGTPQNLQVFLKESITITSEAHIKGSHGIFFNRGVSGSQSYAEQFGNQRPDSIADKVEQEQAYRWLSRGLYEGLIAFIESAKKGQKLRGACYEFHHPGTLAALKKSQKSGVDVNVVYDAKNYGKENHEGLVKAGASSLVKHVRDNEVTQAHNKFFVLLDKNDKPLKVWTGSTNISEKGIFGHCNTGHLIDDKHIAAKYFAYWKLVYKNLDRDSFREAVMSLEDGEDKTADEIPDGISVIFSPRSDNTMLQNYADLIESASEMVCCIYPFNIDKRFQKVFGDDKPYLRYILLDARKTFNTFKTNDRDVEVVAGSYIPSDLDQWAGETNAGKLIKSGVNYLHNKLVLVDPLGDVPIVITGSANYSENSTSKNDENTLIIKGDDRVADIYFTEYVRLFDHFAFREWLNSHEKDFNPFLEEDGKWVGKYFDNPDHLNVKRKLLFKGMARASESP